MIISEVSMRSFENLLINFLKYGFLILISAFMLLPFFWMLTTSFKPANEIFVSPPVYISPNSNFDSYIYLFQEAGIAKIIWNTFIYAFTATALQLFFCSMVGYGLAKFRFPGRDALFMLILSTLIIPFAVLMVPLYIIMRNLGGIDTLWGLVLPGAASAYGIFFLRQYILAFPDELIDAARIDGCGEFRIYWSILLPVIAPGLTSLGLIFFMGSWNNFLWPLIMIKSPEGFTLPIAITSMVSSTISIPIYNHQMAASVLSVLPLLIIFIVFQRRFIEGITSGAVKG